MPEKTYDSVQLLTALDRSVCQHLAPCLAEFGAIHSSGLSGCDGHPGECTLQNKEFSSVSGVFFWWIHRFASEDAVLDVGYGDREFIVETTIFYPSIQARFAPWELLLAHEVPDSQAMSGNVWVLTADFMERTIAALAEGTQKYWPKLLRPKPAIVDRARELRGRRLIYAQEEQRRRDRERASIQASRAFHENRMEEAIALLSPFENDEELPRSSRLLLEAAHKRRP